MSSHRVANEQDHLQDSRLTNIVLHDFRKHVEGLEEQVSRKSTCRFNREFQENQFTTPETVLRQDAASTDLDASREQIAIMQPKGQ